MREAVWGLMAVVLVASGAAAAGASTVAFVPFGEAAEVLAPEVRAVLQGVEGVRLASEGTTRADVRAASEVGLACGPDSDECLVKLALFLRVDRLVVSTASRTPAGIELSLALIEAGTGKRTATARAVVPSEPPRDTLLGDLALELIAPDRVFGSLTVSTSPADASLLVDGAAVASGPLRVRAGEHQIDVARPGFTPWTRRVMVPAGMETPVTVTLAPVAPPVDPAEAGGLSVFVVGATVAVLGAVAVIAGSAVALGIDNALRSPGTISGGQARIDALQAERTAAAAATLGALAVGVGVVMMVTAD